MSLNIKDKTGHARILAALSDEDRGDIYALVDEFVANAAPDEVLQAQAAAPAPARKKPGPKPKPKVSKAEADAHFEKTFPKVDASDDTETSSLDEALKSLED